MTAATLHTNQGPIEVELYDEDAPKTVENFRKLSADGFYDQLVFHRVIPDFMIQGGPFFEEVAHPSGSDFIFFSYTTLTTTGYGNLVPGGQPGRMISGLEMMLGQIFLVTLVAGLVSLWRPGEALRRRRERRETT